MSIANHAVNPITQVRNIWHSRDLIWQMTKREVVGRYRGSVLGLFWSFFNPVLMLIIYTFVFSVVFKARWGTGGESRFEFALILFAGLIVFNLFAECVNRAPTLIIGSAGLSGSALDNYLGAAGHFATSFDNPWSQLVFGVARGLFRDVAQTIGLLVTVLMSLSPIFIQWRVCRKSIGSSST